MHLGTPMIEVARAGAAGGVWVVAWSGSPPSAPLLPLPQPLPPVRPAAAISRF
jgi:hypothetical protein